MNNKLPQNIYNLIASTIKKNITKFVVTAQSSNEKGAGFTGYVWYVSLRCEDTDEELYFVVKQAFIDELLRKSSPIRSMFLNEIYFYDKVWPKLQAFQDIYLKRKGFDKFPKCFATNSEEGSELVMFENLKQQGFQTFDKHKTFDRNHMEFILKEYGKFHAISIAFRALDPQGYSEISKRFTDQFRELSDAEYFTSMVMNHYKLCLNSLVPGKDDDILRKFQKYVEHGMEIFRNSLDYNGNYPVILHGDCWSNNMMFKYDHERNLVDLRLFDLQMFKQGSATTDLAYCIYSSGSKEIFNDFDHYLEVYYNSLSDTIRAFGCNPEQLYPFKVLVEEWKQYCNLGFVASIILWKTKLTPEADVVDFTDGSEDNEQFVEKYLNAKYDDRAYRERTRDVIVHLYENAFL